MERESTGLRLSRGYVKKYIVLFSAPACEVLIIEREPGASSPTRVDCCFACLPLMQ